MFKNTKPVYGSVIRVNRGFYYHYGIYVSDDEVIHFASIKPGHELDPNEAEIISTPLSAFLRDGVLEVKELDINEKKQVRSPEQVVKYARSRLGTKGYNIITNNCEHFANECLYGKKESEQVNLVFDLLGSIFTK